jgi:N-alpha-acetyltransferase 40
MLGGTKRSLDPGPAKGRPGSPSDGAAERPRRKRLARSASLVARAEECKKEATKEKDGEKAKAKGKQQERALVEDVNALSMEEFSRRYFCKGDEDFVWLVGTTASSCTAPGFRVTLTDWAGMRAGRRAECLDLVESSVADHYRASETGWSRARKTKEMRHPAMKFLLLLSSPCQDVKAGTGEEGAKGDVEFRGFLSFMITEEDGYEVVYCYELHLQPRVQGMGMGRKMMNLMEMIGFEVGVEKAMLTVFKSNERAVKVYDKWGYQLDQFSPELKRLRDGTVRESTYVILSRTISPSHQRNDTNVIER